MRKDEVSDPVDKSVLPRRLLCPVEQESVRLHQRWLLKITHGGWRWAGKKIWDHRKQHFLLMSGSVGTMADNT